MSTVEIPMLHDSHNHVAFNISLNNCLNVREMSYNDAFNEISLMDRNNVNIITGWLFYDFDKSDLEKLPPVFICDNFLHTFYLNSKTKNLLKTEYSEIVNNIENTTWVEKNLPAILNFISEINNISPSDINRYFKDIEKKRYLFCRRHACSKRKFY